jgi:CelD/BcsL family acetyltransferase involved in cellulose biosynthesis
MALRLLELTTIDALGDLAPAWDRLWERSEVTIPTARAELVALWLEHFAPKGKARVLAVEDGGELVAALPLIGRKIGRLVSAGDVTWNYWSPNGELLVDPTADEAAMDLLVDGLGGLPWPLLWLEMVPLEHSSWKAFLAAIKRRGLALDVHRRYEIPVVQLDGCWEDYLAGRSKNLRRSMRKDARQLEEQGDVELQLCADFTPEDVASHLRRAFEIERRSWKGRGGSTVLNVPGMFDFYCRQAERLAAWGCLRLALLCHRGEPIAFDLGWVAKGVYHSFKVSYDERYRHVAPGQLLRARLIETLFAAGDIRTIDFQGPATDALASWSNSSYPIGRIVVGLGGARSRALFAGYKTLSPFVRRLRRRR